MKGFTIIEVLIAVFVLATAITGAGLLSMQSLRESRQALSLTLILLQPASVQHDSN